LAVAPLPPQDPHRRGGRSDGPVGFISEALRKGRTRDAIKALREKTGLGQEQARDAVEGMGRHRIDPLSDLSPGEVPRRGGFGWVVLFLLLLAALGYAWLGGPG
jgi:hypothetical protein